MQRNDIMVRKRLAVLTLAGSLLVSAGCATTSDCSTTGSTSFLSRFRLLRNRTNNNSGHDCECCETVAAGIPVTTGCASGSCGLEGPSLLTGDPTLAPAPLPGTIPTLPGPTPLHSPATTSQPPRIVTVPQAQPMPSPP
jgi:hypothetical protein